jgi:hypothetical protein
LSTGVSVSKTFFFSVTDEETNKLDRMRLVSFYSLVQYLWVRPGTYPRVEYSKGAPLS